MSNLFPKYKKRHTLQTALPVKNDSFSFHFPLVSPTAQPLPQAEPPGGNPLTRHLSECSGLVSNRNPVSYSGSGNAMAILAGDPDRAGYLLGARWQTHSVSWKEA